MQLEEARERLLGAAGELFYARGIQAVGMDEIRTASGVSLKRLYQAFPSKHELVEAYLRRRDERWRADLAEYVGRHAATPQDAPAAVFDWLHAWFTAPGFRGCAFINAFGELGAVAEGVARAARDHKDAVHAYVAGLVRDLDVAEPARLADQLALLVDGAITTATISGTPGAARLARQAAVTLTEAAGAARRA